MEEKEISTQILASMAFKFIFLLGFVGFYIHLTRNKQLNKSPKFKSFCHVKSVQNARFLLPFNEMTTFQNVLELFLSMGVLIKQEHSISFFASCFGKRLDKVNRISMFDVVIYAAPSKELIILFIYSMLFLCRPVPERHQTLEMLFTFIACIMHDTVVICLLCNQRWTKIWLSIELKTNQLVSCQKLFSKSFHNHFGFAQI